MDWRLRQSEDRLKNLYYQRTYGISLSEFTGRLTKQNGRCLLCETRLTLVSHTGSSAVVDHCHVNGHIRGILCNECNRGLGYFKDNMNTFKNAIKYLSGEDLSPQGGQ